MKRSRPWFYQNLKNFASILHLGQDLTQMGNPAGVIQSKTSHKLNFSIPGKDISWLSHDFKIKKYCLLNSRWQQFSLCWFVNELFSPRQRMSSAREGRRLAMSLKTQEIQKILLFFILGTKSKKKFQQEWGPLYPQNLASRDRWAKIPIPWAFSFDFRFEL